MEIFKTVSLYMYAHVTKYFKMPKHLYLFTRNRFHLWDVVKFHFFWCWKDIQHFREAVINSSMKPTSLFCLLSHLKLFDFYFPILHV